MMFTQLSLGIFLLGIIIVPMVFAETYTVVNVEMSYIRGCEEITNGCFDPYLVTVRIGDTVIWENADSQGHNVASGDEGAGPDVGAIFDSDFIDPGESFSYTFDAVGTYDYFCMIHPWMKGTVIVETASGTEINTQAAADAEAKAAADAEAKAAADAASGCGPGTILIDGVCELAPTQQPIQQTSQGCGPGTVMVNEVCELDKTSESTSMSIEPLYIIIVVVVIGGVIGAVIAAKRGSKSSGHIQEESVPRKHVKTLETKKTHYLCQNCGTSLKFGARFCGQCGQSVNS